MSAPVRPRTGPRLDRPHPALTGRPLAPQQRGLWFLQQLRPSTSEYNVQIALRMRGPLRLAALQNTLNLLVLRHEPLRTTIRADASGQPRQYVWPSRHISLDPEPVRASADELDAHVRRIVRQEVREPFDLAAGWPMRVRLVRLGDEDHLLVLTFNHLAVDGVSLSILSDELSAVYAALVAGEPVRLPDLDLTFAEHAAWLAGRSVDGAGLEYWRGELDGVGDLELPADRAGHGVGASMITVRREVSEPTVRGLTALARSAGSSLFAACLTGYGLLLHRCTGQRDFAVGMPVAARTEAACERIVGCFMNTVCVRFRINPELPIRGLVQQTGRAVAGALEHQTVPFGEVVRAVRPGRSTARHPLFSAFCSAVDGAPPAFPLAGLTTEVVVADYPVARFDLNATFALGLRHAAIQLECSDALFEPATARQLADRLVSVLDWTAADGDRPVASVPALGRAERAHVLSLLNGRHDG
ncbi:condensation domain-containing protein [Dactylosporangium sp. NPDC000555]|uniref:condensation domain-containing protein n=1 Tax=Dactylosporangium sp. NPDC000555 TaxID=3154260 RepID=UPI00331E816D